MKNLLILLFIFLSNYSNAQLDLESEPSKRSVGVALGLPYINHMNLNIEPHKSIRKLGFYGVSGGVFYQHNVQIGICINYEFVAVEDNPIGLPYKHEGFYQTQNVQYLNFIMTKKFRKISLGMGLFYSVETWKEGERNIVGQNSYSNAWCSDKGGFIFQAFLELNKKNRIGLINRNHGILPYEHNISLALGSDFPLYIWQ